MRSVRATAFFKEIGVNLYGCRICSHKAEYPSAAWYHLKNIHNLRGSWPETIIKQRVLR